MAFVLFQTGQVEFDGLSQSHIECIADEGMPDAYLVHPWNHLVEEMQVFQTQVVACI